MAKNVTTVGDLNREVNRLNKKYCKNTRNHLVVGKNGNGYSVNLTGKPDKRYKGSWHRLKGSMGTSEARVSGYYSGTKSEVKTRLLQNEKDGTLKRIIKNHEPNK